MAGVFASPLKKAGVSFGGFTGGTWSGLPKPFPGLLASGKPIVLAYAGTGESPIPTKINIVNTAETDFPDIKNFNISIPPCTFIVTIVLGNYFVVVVLICIQYLFLVIYWALNFDDMLLNLSPIIWTEIRHHKVIDFFNYRSNPAIR
jgi:hypothetical protein